MSKIEYIGNVSLDYAYYNGEDIYSDGNIEDEILNIVRDSNSDDFSKIIYENKQWPIFYHLSELRTNIIEWIPINKNETVLEIGSGCGALTGKLAEKAKTVTCIELSKKRSIINATRNKNFDNINIKVGNFEDVEKHIEDKYDYILLIGVFEYANMYIQSEDAHKSFLNIVRRHLKKNGKIIIAIENKLGLKYWAGSREDHNGKYYDSIEGYNDIKGPITFSKMELERIFDDINIDNYKFYYPYPDYKFCNTIFSDLRLPRNGELNQNNNNFDQERLITFNESKVFDTLNNNLLFPQFSNSFLITISNDGNHLNEDYIKYSNSRGDRFKIKTIIKSNADESTKVLKYPLNEKAINHINNIYYSYKSLTEQYKETNLKINNIKLNKSILELEYLNGKTFEDIINSLYKKEDYNEIYKKIDEVLEEIIYKAEKNIFYVSDKFKEIFGEYEYNDDTLSLKYSPLDATFSNIIINNSLNLIDYEWMFDFPIPVNFIVYRMINGCSVLQLGNPLLNKNILFNKYNITDYEIDIFRRMDISFMHYIMSEYDGTKKNFIYDYVYAQHDIRNLINDTYISKLYIDQGEGFSEENAITKIINPQLDVIDLEFLNLKNIKKLRFDPIDGFPCIINIEKVESDGLVEKIEESGIFKKNKGETSFYTTDSSYLITGDFTNMSYFKISMKIKIISFKDAFKNQLINNENLILNVKNDYEIIVSDKNKEILELKEINREIERLYDSQKTVLNSILNSKTWRYTNRIISCINSLKNIFKNKNKINSVVENIEHNHNSNDELSNLVKFSIVVPLYNTPKKYLTEMIQSVINQSYENWELILVNGSDVKHSWIEDICIEFSNKDSRIKHSRLQENLGISNNTNYAISLATGDYIALLDHDDVLESSALYWNAYTINTLGSDVIYSDEDHLDNNGNHINPLYKPDMSIDLLYCQMYICHFLVFKKEIFESIGGFDSNFDGSQDYDLMLRFTEVTDKIHHIPKVLYSWRESETSTAANHESKPYAHNAGLNAINAHLKRKYGENSAIAYENNFPFTYKVKYNNLNNKLVSIVIPMKDKHELSDTCIESILERSSYNNFEIIIMNNNSEKSETYIWFNYIKNRDHRIKIIDAKFEFNWSKLNNFGTKNASGEVIIFLNNDTVIISEDWIEELASNALRKDIGVVGAQLLYEDNTIQHAGVVVGMGGWADHIFAGMEPVHYGSPYISSQMNRNVLSVTGACMAISKEKLKIVNGFDEEYIICGSDVKICLDLYEIGFNNLYLASTKLYHLESKSRSSYIPEIDFIKSKKAYEFYVENGDPFFNINLNINSKEPKVSEEKMINKIKNKIKTSRSLINKLSELKNRVSSENTIDTQIHEIQPINFRELNELGNEIRLNLLIPSVDIKHVFGGISTAIKLFEEMVSNFDCMARIIITDADYNDESSYLDTKYKLIKSEVNSLIKYQLVSFSNRYNKNIPVGKNDYFVATGWWTAYNIKKLLDNQKLYYKQNYRDLIYIIQDYEPGFYQWSTKYLLAESTYKSEIDTIAIFNSEELYNFFKEKNYYFKHMLYFKPTLNSNFKKYLDIVPKVKKKKQILLYGRPGTARNAFELIIESLKEWSNIQNDASEWEILSVGEKHADITLSNNTIKSLGKLTLDDYAELMMESYCGISLMVSPHPSYPPLEMATFGMKVITNSYENKDLNKFSENIISLKDCSTYSVAKTLNNICSDFNENTVINLNKEYLTNNNIDNLVLEVKNIIESK